MLTATQWRYGHHRTPTRRARPTLVNGQKYYPEDQTRPITAPMELALLRFHRLFLSGQDRTRSLSYLYGDQEMTVCHRRLDFRGHFSGRRLQGVYPGSYTHWIDLDIDAHHHEDVEWCVKAHAALWEVVMRRGLCAWQQYGPTGTHVFAVFSSRWSRPEAERLCRDIIQEASTRHPEIDFSRVEHFPKGDRACLLPLRFDRVTLLEKPLTLETYTYRGREHQRQSVTRLIDWLSDPDREHAGFDEDLLRATLQPPRRRVRQQLPRPERDRAATLGRQRGRFIENYVDFWTGTWNPPDSIQEMVGMSVRLLYAYGYEVRQVQNIIFDLCERLPDTSFSDQLTENRRAFYKKWCRDIIKMQCNGRQPNVQESNQILGNLVDILQAVGFDPADPDTWHSWEKRFEGREQKRKALLVWDHLPLEQFQGFSSGDLALIERELLPVYGKRTSLEQAIAVTAILLEFVTYWQGEIPVVRLGEVFETLPPVQEGVISSSTIGINWEIARGYSLKRKNKVCALLDKLKEIGWLRVRIKHWHKEGRGRATAYSLGQAIAQRWSIPPRNVPVFEIPSEDEIAAVLATG
jgi:hypothetical protein